MDWELPGSGLLDILGDSDCKEGVLGRLESFWMVEATVISVHCNRSSTLAVLSSSGSLLPLCSADVEGLRKWTF